MEQVVTDDTFQDLGELEQAVMQLIWAGRPMTALAMDGRQRSCWRAPEPKSWLSTGISRGRSALSQ